MFLRQTNGCLNCPSGTYGTDFHNRACIASNSARCFPGSLSRMYLRRMSSSTWSHGHPGKFLPSQVVIVEGLVSGLASYAPFAEVWNRFQPPCDGGSFFARRADTVPQSYICISTTM